MKKSCRGFTLIELLITITIIVLLLSFGVARYNEFNRRQIFDQAVLEFKNNLRSTQQKALSGEKDKSICTADLNGWSLAYETVDRYRIFGKCGAKEFSSRSFNLPGEVTFTGSFPSILFRILGYGPEWVGGNPWSATLTGSGKTQTVQVTKSGEIK